jgi:hypothetical protein
MFHAQRVRFQRAGAESQYRSGIRGRWRKYRASRNMQVHRALQMRDGATCPNHYIDAQAFTQLFEKNGNNKNRKKIAMGVYVIAHNYVRRFRYVPPAWREDAASDAAMLAMSKIWWYQKNCRHKNAFSYFTKVVQNRVLDLLRMEAHREAGRSPWGWKGRSKTRVEDRG